jgi:hypothetical protein
LTSVPFTAVKRSSGENDCCHPLVNQRIEAETEEKSLSNFHDEKLFTYKQASLEQKILFIKAKSRRNDSRISIELFYYALYFSPLHSHTLSPLRLSSTSNGCQEPRKSDKGRKTN